MLGKLNQHDPRAFVTKTFLNEEQEQSKLSNLPAIIIYNYYNYYIIINPQASLPYPHRVAVLLCDMCSTYLYYTTVSVQVCFLETT